VTNPKSWSPTEKQEYFLAAVEDEVLFGGAAGGGKALDLATPIATPDGWCTMADLQPGDDVFDETGQPCKVLAISEVMHDRPCYELTFSDGSKIVADAEHLWVTLEGNIQYVRTTQQLNNALIWGDALTLPNSPGLETLRGVVGDVTITAVVPCESRPVKCIKVSSKSHLYLAGTTYLPTHNSDALIMDVLGLGEEEPSISIPRFRGLLIRKTFPQLREIIDRTRIIYPLIDPGATYREADKEWLFTSGAKIIFGFCERDPDVLQYQGAEFQWIGIDELGHFATPYVYDYLTSRLRSPDKRLSAKMRASCNPGPKWIMEKFGIKKDGADSMVTLNVNGRFIHRRFISSKLSDNNHLDGTGYLERLMMLPDVERQQLLEGRWDVYNVPGAIYKDQIDESRSNGRIRPLPYDPMLRVHAIWDLGWNDKTSIILVQKGASDVRIIDYIEESHKTLDYYSTLLRERKWNWGEMWLPHDGETRNLQTGRSAKEVLDSQGWNVRITPKLDIESGIRAARMMFGQVYFDADKADVLVDHLYNYRRAINAQTGEATAPVHDNHSHAADAFRYLGVCVGSLTNSEWSKGTLNYANMNYA